MTQHQARKRFGQHFLTDTAVIEQIVQSIAPHAGEAMVEIGPGLAAMTQPLVERLGHLHVIELDRDLAARLYDEQVMRHVPDQVIVNEYLVDETKTQGIAAHVDHVRDFGPVVVTLSLLEGWSMRFTREGHNYVDHLLEPGSIAVLAGASRYEWQHSIPPRKFEREGGFKTPRQRRVSVTFRTTGGGL